MIKYALLPAVLGSLLLGAPVERSGNASSAYAAALKVTTERAFAEGTLLGWQGPDQKEHEIGRQAALPDQLRQRAESRRVSVGPVDKAVAALRSDSVYLDPGSNRNLDVDAVRKAIGTAPIKIAVLPRIESVNQVATLPRTLAADLPGNTIGVISGRYFYAGSEVVCTGSAGQAAAKVIKANEAALDANNSADSPSDLTKPLTEFVAAIKAAPTCPEVGGRGDRYADEPGGGTLAAGPDDTASILPWVLSGIGAGVLVIGALVLLTRRRTRVSAAARRAEATALVRRLGDELAEVPTGAAREEAAARHGEADAILVGATTDAQFAAARAAALEGLQALGGTSWSGS